MFRRISAFLSILPCLQLNDASETKPERCRAGVFTTAGLWLTLDAMVLMGASVNARAQSNEWTWWGGQDQSNPPIYGTRTTPAADNWPASRSAAAGWMDENGNLWLFGGSGMNDLWEYIPSSHEWAWMNGSDDPSQEDGVYGTLLQPADGNTPGGRSSAAYWTDTSGNFWLFGGNAVDSAGNTSYLNDLWEFNPNTNQWAWIAGSNTITQKDPEGGLIVPGVYGTEGTAAKGNTPGGRMESVSWIDKSGKLWLFGGWGFDSEGNDGELNDLWVFDPSNDEWTWMGGSDVIPTNGTGVEGVYGTEGTPSTSNIPSSTFDALSWADGSGNFWLYGGWGVSQSGGQGTLNDLWEFNPTTKQWTWYSGSAALNLGTLGVPASDLATSPGGIQSSAVWTDSKGNFWLYGGSYSSGIGSAPSLSDDMWLLEPFTMQWAWMGGAGPLPQNCCAGDFPIFGSLGSPGPGAIPGSREQGISWTDSSGNLWLFGGYGWAIDSTETPEEWDLDDLWEFNPAVGTLPPAVMPTIFPPPVDGVVTINTPTLGLELSDAMSNASIYYTTDGTTPTTSSNLYSSSTGISYEGSGGASTVTVQAVAKAPGYPISGVLSETYSVDAVTGPPSLSPAGGTYSTPQQVKMSDNTPGATIYYSTDGSTPTASSTAYTGPVTVSTTEALNAVAIAPGWGTSGLITANYIIPPGFTLTTNPTSLTVDSGASGTTTVSVSAFGGFNSAVSFACSGQQSGVTCGFNPTTVTPTGGAAATTTLTFTASALAESRPTRGPFLPVSGITLAALVFVFNKRKAVRGILLVTIFAAGFGMLSGCGSGGAGSGGGGGGGGGTTPTVSTVTITATSGSIQQTTTITLTLN
jgi:Chitobiase/beta-hexosaminidase C-terminal domain/Fn3 associated/Galactose oxidase, central domain